MEHSFVFELLGDGECFIYVTNHIYVISSANYKNNFTDAKDLVRLLPIFGWPVQDHTDTPHIWPRPQGTSYHSALSNLALIPQVHTQVPHTWECGQSLQEVPEGRYSTHSLVNT